MRPLHHSTSGGERRGSTRTPAAAALACCLLVTIHALAVSSVDPAAADPAGSSAGPPGGSAEAGFGSTGADPGPAAPPWAQDVMPTPIADDPFFDYPPPARITELPPGELIKERPAQTVQLGLPATSTHQFMFRSTDSHGEPVPATATLIEPVTPWRGPGPRPVVVNAAAIDSLGADCTPGYQVIHRPLNIEIPPFTPTVLGKGYAVLVPDHEGPRMAYAAGILAGHIVLDSIRAMRRLPDVPDVADPAGPVAVTGYSGGAIASGWAAQLQPVYAPEVTLAGVASGGVPADLSLLPETMNGTLGSGLFLAASLGLAREYPELLTNLNDFGQTAARSPVKNQCAETLEALGAAMQPIEKFTYDRVLDSPRVREVMAENRLGGMRPDAPMMLFAGSSSVAIGDEWIPESGVKTLFREWCSLGANVTYRPVAGEHLTAPFTSMPMVVDWLSKRLEGVPRNSECDEPGSP